MSVSLSTFGVERERTEARLGHEKTEALGKGTDLRL
jgi:hypothetical protein